MANQELVSKLSRVADNEMFLAEAYTWQSAAVRGKAPFWVTEVLPSMAMNDLLRATIVTNVLACLGCTYQCSGSRSGQLVFGDDPAGMYRFDRKKIRETIGLCDEVLELYRAEPVWGCLVQEVVKELRREQESQYDMLGMLLDQAEHRGGGSADGVPQGPGGPAR
ncbi:MAG TPA: hypothetical protein VKF36_14820 [Syntrophorhabdales bacterium]|nr:hypothetical protein [Syntrophorhabdales bacterium]